MAGTLKTDPFTAVKQPYVYDLMCMYVPACVCICMYVCVSYVCMDSRSISLHFSPKPQLQFQLFRINIQNSIAAAIAAAVPSFVNAQYYGFYVRNWKEKATCVRGQQQ